MKPPIYVRELTIEENRELESGLKSNSAFVVRRCQILLSSAAGKSARIIADELHCSDQSVRRAIHAFSESGLDCLEAKSHRPLSVEFSFSAEALARLPDIVHSSPRDYGIAHSLWSLQRLAAVCHREKLTAHPVSIETMREAIQRAGINWKRARKRMHSGDASYEVKKNDGIN